jgi:hypothetical protein
VLVALLAPLVGVAVLSVAAVLISRPVPDEAAPLPWERWQIPGWLLQMVILAATALVLIALASQGSGRR